MENSIPYPIYIKAVNPGYSVDGISNVGEFIELARIPTDPSPDATDAPADLPPLLLAGLSIGYTNASGNTSILLEFADGAMMTGESILLRLASSPDRELADLLYSKTLAMKAGPLTLLSQDGEVLDSLCWTGKDTCAAPFNSAAPTTLVRDINPETNTFSFVHTTDYLPTFNPDSPGYYEAKTPDETPAAQCRNLKFSEILTYYETDKTEQFVEFYNPTAEQILLDGCQIKYKNKFHALTGIVRADGYLAYYPTDFSFTKNPTTSNTVALIDADGTIADTLIYYHGQKKATAYAWLGYDQNGDETWSPTYDATPGQPNNYQAYQTCPAGKVINTTTGNCVKPTIATTTTKICAAGYELNPTTNRCRKIKTNTGADYEITTNAEHYDEQTSFIALYAVIALVALGIIYIIFQFRHELKKFFDKVFRRVR